MPFCNLNLLQRRNRVPADRQNEASPQVPRDLSRAPSSINEVCIGRAERKLDVLTLNQPVRANGGSRSPTEV
ncbi:hypothetical protein WR25_13710 [Diploscapter pachys]|uniref:Uncharacterized protein n=1 Tax=Diploscapter pachys TaxID=2018661 RepID=A0A2A2LF08_9BILA|nr:hypothetical protein WR25_13710 [Diploscapter pachys]